jgi:hypothetical protein
MVFQLLPNGLPIGENSYINKSEFIPRNLPTVFLKSWKWLFTSKKIVGKFKGAR